MIRAARYKPVVWTTADFPDLDRSMIGLKGSPTIVSRTWIPEIRKVNSEAVAGETPQATAAQLLDKLWEKELPKLLGWTS
jgi:electron transfer flavoprotein beta subunit